MDYNIFCQLLIISFEFNEHINPLNAKSNPICHLLALLIGETIADIDGLRVNETLKTEELFNKLANKLKILC